MDAQRLTEVLKGLLSHFKQNEMTLTNLNRKIGDGNRGVNIYWWSIRTPVGVFICEDVSSGRG